MRLASESRSTQAAARQLGISPKLLYKWQKATQPVLAVGGEENESAAMRQLRAENRRLQQERDILKKALAQNRNIALWLPSYTIYWVGLLC